MLDAIKNTLYYVGEYGPTILWIFAVVVLYKLPSYFGMFIFGSVVSIITNYILKGLFKQPRPNQDAYIQSIENQYKGIIGFGRYGMPSGHTQAAVFTTIYIWFATKNMKLTFLCLIISIITMYQRVEYNFHTIAQVIAGAGVGTLVAYFFFLNVKKANKTKLKYKPDDNYFGEN